MSKSIFDVGLLDLLPASIASDEEIINICKAINPAILETNEAIKKIELYSYIDSMDEAMLNMFAVNFRMTSYEWTLTQSLTEKRNLIKKSFEIHRYKGTKYALEQVISLLNLGCTIQEWFEYGGDPYHFKIQVLDLGNRGLTPEEYPILRNMIEQYKNARSWLDEINIYLSVSGNVPKIIGAILKAHEIEIYPKS